MQREAYIRVLVIADPHIPVPPVHYGGAERIVAVLCDGLAARGHKVDLLAAAGSKNYGGRTYQHMAPTPRKLSRAYRKIWFQILSWRAARRADLVICHCRSDYLWLVVKSSKPIVFHLHNPTAQHEIDRVLSQRQSNIRFVGVSYDQISHLTPKDLIDAVYNAVDIHRFPFRPTPADPPYFAFLGRLTANKGVHLAIAAAREADVRLKIAGTVSAETGGADYFATEVKPRLGAGVEYVGPVDDDQKAALLGGAKGLLFPIQWREPFGIVMAEALACGCPVIGWRNGSAPEVVRHGETGFVVESVTEMAAAIRNAGNIDRTACRLDAVTRFSPDALVEAYHRVIDKLLQERPPFRSW